ncbi:universal stress protein [Mesosutterella sp. AGMB02718]|uniref:Universal stress protein n=1 Tax=Mesosutterella faecium TaxID=2925194 RepID=A0ABT7IKV6_9BURK|nr:universal stress protein [Mesosutterella sp. AGMB02718]MDL2059003.1 universal stress protein [Mesosutterella sp. AGMB02718]
MKILLPIDGSEYSKNAIDFVASRTTLLGTNPKIELLNVQVPLPARASRLVGREALDKYYKEEADKVFEVAKKSLKRNGIEVAENFAVGAPDEKIAAEAEKLGADLIVMGSRGLTPLKGLFLGSVTTGVLARTKCPVLLLRGKESPTTDALRVGIAVDGSKYGQAAVDHVLKDRALFGKDASFFLINVVNDYAGAVMPDMAGMALPALSEDEILELQKKEFAETVSPLRPLFANAGIKPKEVCLVGNPSDEIAAYAKKSKLDILVMGSHGYTRFKSAVMGSTATHIAAEGNVPLLIIRAGDSTTPDAA